MTGVMFSTWLSQAQLLGRNSRNVPRTSTWERESHGAAACSTTYTVSSLQRVPSAGVLGNSSQGTNHPG